MGSDLRSTRRIDFLLTIAGLAFALLVGAALWLGPRLLELRVPY